MKARRVFIARCDTDGWMVWRTDWRECRMLSAESELQTEVVGLVVANALEWIAREDATLGKAPLPVVLVMNEELSDRYDSESEIEVPA